VTKADRTLPVRSLGPVGAYHCEGARSDTEAATITRALKAAGGGSPDIASYHYGRPPDDPADVWIEGEMYWITRQSTST
jgi:hypothetical protein